MVPGKGHITSAADAEIEYQHIFGKNRAVPSCPAIGINPVKGHADARRQKEGECKWNGQRMILADLPGSYSLSAGSDEEVITKDYITSGNADLVLVMADASQLKRILYILADFVGTKVPAVLVLNMMDVAQGQGITVNTGRLSEKLGIPVVPMSAIRKKDYRVLYETMEKINVHPLLISLICDVLMNVLYFACMMASFVLGITFGFNLMEETGYLARISFLFDNTMSRVGLQGKTIMPFFMGLGCTIAGATGTRVVDKWGQRVLVIVSIFLFMFLMMWVVYKVFGNSLAPKEERVGLIMELPPYHKPDLRNTIYVTFERTLDIFWRALRVIFIVSIVFFVLTYGFGGNAENSILYRVGVVIEPVTMFFGLKWEAFLAFIFAISFNMPCISALAATARETHSVKWTAKIGVFYAAAALLVSCIVYHVGLLVF